MRLCTTALLLAATALAGCAHQAAPPTSTPNPVSHAVGQPFRDLNISRAEIPQVLKEIKAPYDPPASGDCKGARQEVDALTDALGPDVDAVGAAPRPPGLVADLAAQEVASVLGLPFRSVIRRMSGAENRDRDLRTAVLKGLLRRSYLKGLAAELCKPAPPPPRPPLTPPAPPPPQFRGPVPAPLGEPAPVIPAPGRG